MRELDKRETLDVICGCVWDNEGNNVYASAMNICNGNESCCQSTKTVS